MGNAIPFQDTPDVPMECAVIGPGKPGLPPPSVSIQNATPVLVPSAAQMASPTNALSTSSSPTFTMGNGQVVRAAPARQVGEVGRLNGDAVSMRIYDNTSGLTVGDPLGNTSRQLPLAAGPGKLDGMYYDGLRRPGERVQAISQVVRAAPARQVGEVGRLNGDAVSMRIYDNTSGLTVGDPLGNTSRQLPLAAGPGKLDGMYYDGLRRPGERVQAISQVSPLRAASARHAVAAPPVQLEKLSATLRELPVSIIPSAADRLGPGMLRLQPTPSAASFSVYAAPQELMPPIGFHGQPALFACSAPVVLGQPSRPA
eukprot:TRINITY_DN5222_c0_g2_i2.p1 TRINITY_DN5222_c0_g2~~TRINITY_DN5222_c0_g2_i2.p1  ORF type:complete len:313 (+),score=31.56 TRINITY_DN5222_c0_g2_i2:1007-1945(+)